MPNKDEEERKIELKEDDLYPDEKGALSHSTFLKDTKEDKPKPEPIPEPEPEPEPKSVITKEEQFLEDLVSLKNNIIDGNRKGNITGTLRYCDMVIEEYKKWFL